MNELVDKIWHDPVWSAVIAGIITIFLVWIASKVFAYIKGISIREYFKKQISYSIGTFILFASIFFIVGIIIYFFPTLLDSFEVEIIILGSTMVGVVMLAFTFAKGLKTADKLDYGGTERMEADGKLLRDYEAEIKSLKNEVSNLSPKGQLTDAAVDEVVNHLFHERDYNELKNSDMFQHFDKIIYRAHENFSFSDLEPEIVAFYRYKKLLKPSTRKPHADCYELSDLGENLARIYLTDKFNKM